LGEVLGVDEIAKATPPSLEESEKEPLNVLSNFVHTREIPKEATDVDGKTAKGLTIQTTECTSWPEGTAFP
jgi:hypothetical protein